MPIKILLGPISCLTLRKKPSCYGKFEYIKTVKREKKQNFTVSLASEKIANKYLVFLLLILGTIFAILRGSFSQAEDMGIFVSVQGLVSQGYNLYSQVYDNKDPLFHYANAMSFSIFGLRGPFLLDALFVIASGPLAFLIARELKIRKIPAFVGALIFLLTLTGFNYNSLRTQIHAIDLIFLAILLLLRGKYSASGITSASVIFFKMPVALFLIVFILLIKTDNLRKNSVEFFKGFSSFVLIMISIMQIRGEFLPYLEMVKDNFRYQDSYQSLVGQELGAAGHIQIWNSFNKSFIGFIFIGIFTVVLYFLCKKNLTRENKILFYATVCLYISTFLYLLSSAMWPHHLQILAISTPFHFWFFTVAWDTINWSPDLKFHRFISVTLLCTIGIFLLLSSAGTSLNLKPTMPLKNWIAPQWSVPTEIRMLNDVVLPPGKVSTVSRLGSGDDTGWGAFLNKPWVFSCSRMTMDGKESLSQVEDFITCLSTTPTVILVAPAYLGLKDRQGSYPLFLRKSQALLKEKFECNPYDQGFSICVRKSN
jgi:hypothetical protein